MSANADQPETVLREFVDAFAGLDSDAMSELLDEHVVAHITNDSGGADRIEGRTTLLGRIGEVDYGGADLRMGITSSVQPAPDLALAMVEVRAERGADSLHNHAAHLCRVRGGRIVEWWMVEALPARSEAFWRGPGRP
jgi:ketosteroid isomerase-like protein